MHRGACERVIRAVHSATAEGTFSSRVECHAPSVSATARSGRPALPRAGDPDCILLGVRAQPEQENLLSEHPNEGLGC